MERIREFSATTAIEVSALMSKAILEEYLEGGYLVKEATIVKNERGRYVAKIILTLNY